MCVMCGVLSVWCVDYVDLGLDERFGAKTASKTSKTAMSTWSK